jgi:hypothetical protein
MDGALLGITLGLLVGTVDGIKLGVIDGSNVGKKVGAVEVGDEVKWVVG